MRINFFLHERLRFLISFEVVYVIFKTRQFNVNSMHFSLMKWLWKFIILFHFVQVHAHFIYGNNNTCKIVEFCKYVMSNSYGKERNKGTSNSDPYSFIFSIVNHKFKRVAFRNNFATLFTQILFWEVYRNESN